MTSAAANSALPRAVVSRAVLADSAAVATSAGGALADLRRDAWGHGVAEAAEVVTAAGVRQVLVDDGEVAARLRSLGVDAVTTGHADIDSATLFGLPGSGRPPVLRLVGTVMSTKPLRRGDAVSYGYTHRAGADTTVALVTGGYAQGIVRALGNHGRVEIEGALRPIVGRVAMDVCVVDLEGSDVPEGTDVTYFGGEGAARDGLTDWARVTGMTTGELLAVAGMRNRREWQA